jgi:16S rRNA (guanine527-N7)-methyltransferase
MIRPVLESVLAEAGIELPEGCYPAFELFTEELRKWNRKVNLTAISSDSDVAVKHIVDSLIFAACVQDGDVVLDIGSGAGVPAIPLKIARPGVKVVSVDAVGKKISFQRHVARMLAFKDFEAVHCRVESLHAIHPGRYDVIVSRAFSSLETFVALAAPLLKCDGKLIAMKGPGVHDEMSAGIRSLGFEISSVHAYELPLNRGMRNLVTISAVNRRE